MENFLNKYDIYILVLITFISLVFWDSFIVYPVKLFVVLIHEISHAIIAVLSGGTVDKIFLSENLYGITYTKGGNLLLISSAGYLGSLVIGISLLISGYKRIFGKWFTSLLSAVILVSSINLISNGMIVFFSLIISLIFYISPRYFHAALNSFILKFIGLVSIFYVVTDIKDDLITTKIRETDTQIIEYLTGIPAIVIGFIWLIISVGALFMVLKYSKKENI